MPIADYPTFQTLLANPSQNVPISKVHTNGATSVASHLCNSLWLATGYPAAGSTPGASAVCTNATAGAMPLINGAGTDLRAWLSRVGCQTNLGAVGKVGLQLCDRLVHMGGLDATNTSAQTVSTSALTRSTSGVNVIAGLEIYTSIGVTQTTVTASYTNDNGVSGQTSQPIQIGGTGDGVAGRIFPLSLAAGDRGVQAVSSLTLAGSTGTVGNFGITLYKPISPVIPVDLESPTSFHPLLDCGGYAPLIDANACLFWIAYSAGQVTFYMTADFRTFED